MFISMAEFISSCIVVGLCAAKLYGVLVRCILNKKHDREVVRLLKELEDTKAELKNLSKFRCLYNRYRKYKEYEGNSSPRSEDFLNWKGLDEDV